MVGFSIPNFDERILFINPNGGYTAQRGKGALSYKCKKIVNKRRDNFSIYKTGWRSIARNNALLGKVKCLSCGKLMHRGIPTKDGVSFYLSCCSSHKTRSIECSARGIRLDTITVIVDDKIRDYMSKVFGNQMCAEFKSLTAEIVNEFVEYIYVGRINLSNEIELVIFWNI